MATKTLILRPVRVTSDDESLVSLYPSSTTMTNAHTLVNEEVADDDATYILLTAGGASANYYFTFNKPDDLITITSVTINSIDKLESGTGTGGVSVFVDGSSYACISSRTLTTTEYNIFSGAPITNSDTLFEALNNATPNTEIYATRSVSTTSSKTSPIRTTQAYMEITYEAIEPDSILIKKDNTWSTVNYTSVYYKTDNSWVLSDTSILQNNQKYTIREVE